MAEASVDTFGTGGNQFTIDFVPISGSTNPTSGYGIVNNDYRMGTYEITQDQWNKFKAAYGTVTGSAAHAYETDSDVNYLGPDLPTNNVSWYEAAQFVNWLNTSTGHHAAYRFTGTQGTSNYTFANWATGEADDGTNLFRHKDAYYFLPTEQEWVKAAYWNGTTLQDYATKPGESLTRGDGTSGTGWNLYYNGWANVSPGPWAVGNGSQELNGTYDMMGNVSEWMESPSADGIYNDRPRGLRGGAHNYYYDIASSSFRYDAYPFSEWSYRGFRVASLSTPIPEPSTLLIWSVLGTLGMAGGRYRRYALRRSGR